MDKIIQQEKVEIFHQLHRNNFLVLANVWDTLSTKIVTDCGHKAIATSSSALSQINGYQDGENIPFEELLEKLTAIVKSTHLPVTADIENGFALTDEQLEKNIIALLDTGIVGINYEDSSRRTGLLIPIEQQVSRIQLIKKTATNQGINLFVNARIDTYVHGDNLASDEKCNETIIRGKAYKAAGADCIFPILIQKETELQQILEEVDLPLNVMNYGKIPSYNRLKEMGVTRLSMGGSTFKVVMGRLKEYASNLLLLKEEDAVRKSGVDGSYFERLIEK